MKHKYLMYICQEYITSEKFPGYAIWLNGAWGCGKTFLCQKVKEDLDPAAFPIWNISLFGVKVMDEIDDKLFEAAHPLVSEGKTGISMLYKISRVAVKHKFNVDIKDIGEAIPDLLKKEPRTCRALIVDDIERSQLKPDELFGYFSSLLDDGIRIIFVGNEKEYMKTNENEKERYNETKEKLIGQTYQVSADFENAVNAFIKEMELAEELKEPLYCVVKNLKIENLRIIKQCLYGWYNLYDNIKNPDIKEKKEYMKEIFDAYIIFMSQYKMGVFTKDFITGKDDPAWDKEKIFKKKIQLAWAVYGKYTKGFNDEQITEKEKTDLNLAGFLYGLYIQNTWVDIILKGRAADTTWLNEVIEEDFNKRYHPYKGTSLDQIQNIINYPSQSKAVSIEQLLETCIDDFNNGKYLQWVQVVIFVNTYEFLLKEEIMSLKYNKEYLVILLDEFIGKYGEEIQFTPSKFEVTTSIDTLKTVCKDFEGEVKNKLEKIVNIIEEKEVNRTEKMLLNKDDFFSYIKSKDPLNESYKGINSTGFMSRIDVDRLFSWLSEEQNFEMDYTLLHFLSVCYGENIGNLNLRGIYFDDLENVKKLCEKYDEMVKELQYTFDLSKRQYGNLKKEYEALIEYMEKEIETEKQKRQSEAIV